MESELDYKAYTKYPELSEEEIKVLVVDDKWLASLTTAVYGEIDRVSPRNWQARSVNSLEDATPRRCRSSEADVVALSLKVSEFLEKMGALWN